VSRCLHLPEDLTPKLKAAGAHGSIDPASFKTHGVVRTDWHFSPGMVLACRYFLISIGGYDEFYENWGCEDDDLIKRLSFLGLHPESIGDRTFYLHQWHPRHQGMDSEVTQSAIAANRTYLRSTNTIRRNPDGWGRARARRFLGGEEEDLWIGGTAPNS
jgi:hypothetical protein